MISLAKAYSDVSHAYRKNLSVWLLAGLIVASLSLPTSFFDPEAAASYLIVWVLSFVLLILVSPGLTSMGLLSVRGKKPTLSEIPDKAHLSLKILGYFILYFLMVMLGTVALIIPGIYLAVRYWPAQYILVEDGKVGVFDALTRSQKLTKGKILVLLGVFLVFGLIFIGLTIVPSIIFSVSPDDVGFWQVVVSAVVTILLFPATTVAGASVYKQLTTGVSTSSK